MLSTGDILNIRTPEEFDRAAMKVFHRQARECAPFREYLELVGIDPAKVSRVNEIPFLPIELFKTHRVYCGTEEPEAIFTSSSTGGEGVSKHHISHLADYEKTYTRGFELFYGPVRRWSIFALLPSYLEREGSSLVRMADGLIRQGHENGRGGGFYLYDHGQLLRDMGGIHGEINDKDSLPNKILLGVSYALLDLAEELAASGEKLPPQTVVMETGGMKGRREEISKARMHAILQDAFGVSEIHSEYGMAELMSQAYSTGGGIFRTPPWMRMCVRDLADPFDVRHASAGGAGDTTGGAGGAGGGKPGLSGGVQTLRGGINIIDLANLDSCAFIQTQDIGRLMEDGGFMVEGRVARSDIRGCNLLVQ